MCQLPANENAIHPIVLPFTDLKSANTVRKQLSGLSKKINHTVQPLLRSCNIDEDLKEHEPKPPLINQQCMVYYCKCNLCMQSNCRLH